MKKIVRQQNYLKQLIDSQENQPLTKSALKSLVRGCLEPLLDEPEEGVVLHRIINKSGVQGLLKRLEFSGIDSYDFSDEGDLLKEKVWANTEFLCVLTHRFVVILLWDNKVENSNYVRYYSIFNSKLQNEALDIIDRNTSVNIKVFQESFKPDRRDNVLLNNSLRRVISNFDEASKDAVLGFAQVQSEKEEVELNQNVREIAHEIRNQLSICDLYSEIMKKYCVREGVKDENILNSLACISRSLKMAGHSLLALKSSEKADIKPYKLKELISNIADLTKVYFECDDIECIIENDTDVKIPVDENKFSAAVINLVKNASEAFKKDGNELGMVSKDSGKYIKISTGLEDDFVQIKVSNNAGKIEEPEKIFTSGFSTKSNGRGLGLMICKKSIEEMYGKIYLNHTGDDYTEFVIKIAKVG